MIRDSDTPKDGYIFLYEKSAAIMDKKTRSSNFSKTYEDHTQQNKHIRENTLHCQICNMTFLNKEKLTIHLKTHSQETPYQCIQCEQSFSTKSNLINHTKTHRLENDHLS